MSSDSTSSKDLRFIQMRGSSTVMKLIQQIGMQYMDEYPNIHLPLLGGGSAIGYKSALDGTTDIGMASGQIPANIQVWSRKHKYKIEEVTIATDAIVAIVNPANPINDLTMEQLHDIFTGGVTDWSALGNYSGPITVLSHDPQLGTYEPWKRQVAGKDHITLRAKVLNGVNPLMRAITTDRYAIGYIGSTFLNKDKVKPIAINGVLPTYENIKQGIYPIRTDLQLLVSPNAHKEVKQFIAYCLDANKGQVIIREAGLVPVAHRS